MHIENKKNKKKEARSPIKWIAYQPEGNAISFMHLTDDPRLANHRIPEGVDATRYLAEYSELLDRLEQTSANGNTPLTIPETVSHDASVKTNSTGFSSMVKVTGNMAENMEASNFRVWPIRRICFVDRDGRADFSRELIQYRICINQAENQSDSIRTCDLEKLCKNICKRYSSAIMNYRLPSADKIIEAEFREMTAKIPTVVCYFQAGWQCVNNRMLYLHDGSDGIGGMVQTGLNLPCDQAFGKEQAGRTFLYARRLYSDLKAMDTMLLFSLTGILYRLFADAGYPPRFVLFLNGKSGSLKTTIGKILFTQLTDLNHRDTPRRIDTDTIVSFERGIVEGGHDTVTLIDDYSPAKTTAKKAEMQNRLEAIIRMIGDGATKSRSNAQLEDIRGEGVNGTVVLTGELKGKGLSSNLRCLYCIMSREQVDTSIVSWFQENPFAYTSFLNFFADFISSWWNEIMALIKAKFPEYRMKIGGHISERRIIDSAVTLWIVSDIISRFLVHYCSFADEGVESLIANMRQSVIANALISQEMSTEEAYTVTYLRALDELMRVGRIRLYKSKDLCGRLELYDGFLDDEYFYFIPGIVFGKVSNMLYQTNRYFPLDVDSLAVALCEDGIIKAVSNGKGKKTYYARVDIGDGIKKGFLKIKKAIYRAVVDGSYDIDVN